MWGGLFLRHKRVMWYLAMAPECIFNSIHVRSSLRTSFTLSMETEKNQKRSTWYISPCMFLTNASMKTVQFFGQSDCRIHHLMSCMLVAYQSFFFLNHLLLRSLSLSYCNKVCQSRVSRDSEFNLIGSWMCFDSVVQNLTSRTAYITM